MLSYVAFTSTLQILHRKTKCILYCFRQFMIFSKLHGLRDHDMWQMFTVLWDDFYHFTDTSAPRHFGTNLCLDSWALVSNCRVRTGPVPGFGPGRSKTAPDRSRIFFWTGAGPCTTFFDKLCMRQRRHCYCLADRTTPCVRAPAITVGRINSPAAAQHGAVG